MWRRYQEFGSPEERNRGKPRITTAVQDRFIHLRILREITLTATMLTSALQNIHNIIVLTLLWSTSRF
jgi:hypothetical protein